MHQSSFTAAQIVFESVASIAKIFKTLIRPELLNFNVVSHGNIIHDLSAYST